MSDEPRWYSVNTIGMATLCRGEADARREAADADAMWPRHAPHVATQLVPMAEIDRLREDRDAFRASSEIRGAEIARLRGLIAAHVHASNNDDSAGDTFGALAEAVQDAP